MVNSALSGAERLNTYASIVDPTLGTGRTDSSCLLARMAFWKPVSVDVRILRSNVGKGLARQDQGLSYACSSAIVAALSARCAPFPGGLSE